MSNCKLLVGAPDAHEWEPSDLTVNDFLPPFMRFLKSKQVTKSSLFLEQAQSTAVTTPAAWRSLSQKAQHLPTGFSQRAWLQEGLNGNNHHGAEEDEHEDPEEYTSFLTATSMPSDLQDSADENELTQFLDRSFALHDEDAAAAAQNLTVPEDTTTSFSGPPRTPSRTTQPPRQCRQSPAAPHLTALFALPTAAHLAHLNPQTVTVDLIVGLISLPAARTVNVRRTGRQIDLIELLVGDETRAGFSITCWISPVRQSRVGKRKDKEDGSGKKTLEKSLAGLRVGDVILVRSVALAHFRGVVHGQILGGRMGGGTSVRLLYRRGGVRRVSRRVIKPFRDEQGVDEDDAAYDSDTFDSGGGGFRYDGDKVWEKTRRVRDWVWKFVGPVRAVERVERDGGGGRGSKRRRTIVNDLPPDDTQ